jgi:uncharacterized membrane protein
MEKSIETIWKEGFLKSINLHVPRLNDLYNQKSQHVTDDLIRKMRKEMWLMIPASIMPAIISIAVGNHFIWAIISFLITIPWFFIAKRHYQEIKNIDYTNNCYNYLKQIKEKLERITKFNQKLSVYSVPVILLPMLIYTYFNNIDKTFGEIVGNAELGGSNLWIFLFLPIMTLFSFVLFNFFFQVGNTIRKKINTMLLDMEELRGA